MSRSERKPLPARSVVLSLLLGAHPGEMAAADLVAAGRRLGVGEQAVRVALTRAVAAGDLVRTDGTYALGARLVERQRRQDLAVEHAAGPWDGTWEQVVVVSGGRSAADRAALRTELAAARMAELREGVWMRPANLGAQDVVDDPATLRLAVAPLDDAPTLAARLWDLTGWADRGEALLAELATTTDPALRLAVAADLVRHLTTDPLLPSPLLPTDWPGSRLRSTYADYQAELTDRATVRHAAQAGTPRV